MNAAPRSTVNVLVYALLGIMVIAAALVIAASVFHFASTELVVSVLGLAGVIVAALVGLLNAQLSNLHATVNGRMDELVTSTRQAAFHEGHAEGKSTVFPPPADPNPPVTSGSQPPSSSG